MLCIAFLFSEGFRAGASCQLSSWHELKDDDVRRA